MPSARSAELQAIDSSDERLSSLRRMEESLMRQIGAVCQRLSQERSKASRELSRSVMGELADLRMERARFDVLLQQAEHPAGCIVGERRYKFDAKGMDDVEFMLSANPGRAAPVRWPRWLLGAKLRASCWR